MKSILEKIVIIIGTLVLLAIILSLPTLLLWNWLMPKLFELPYLTFWQALGINLLTGVLFRSPEYSNDK